MIESVMGECVKAKFSGVIQKSHTLNHTLIAFDVLKNGQYPISVLRVDCDLTKAIKLSGLSAVEMLQACASENLILQAVVSNSEPNIMVFVRSECNR